MSVELIIGIIVGTILGNLIVELIRWMRSDRKDDE